MENIEKKVQELVASLHLDDEEILKIYKFTHEQQGFVADPL